MEINIEHRSFSLSEVRVAGEGRQISGHAAVFNKLSEDMGGFREALLDPVVTVLNCIQEIWGVL